jgi:hypothetical protein
VRLGGVTKLSGKKTTGAIMKMTKAGQKKVGKVMGEYKEGTLHSGKGGKVVKSRDQAIAIAMSEAAKKMGRMK